MLKQIEIDWTQSVHIKENNFRSQSFRDENWEGLSRQNRIIYKALKRGDKPNNDIPRVFNEETEQVERIGSLPRRILDINTHLKKLGINERIESRQMEGSKFCEYYLIKINDYETNINRTRKEPYQEQLSQINRAGYG